MTYIVEKPAASLANKERPLVTIEFAPLIHPLETEYEYPHPQFVFGDLVTLINEYPETEYTVCGLELIESKTPSGKLLSQPRWKYKISDGQQTYWKEESALTRYSDKLSTGTCLTCSKFQDLNRKNGSGVCQLFDKSVRGDYSLTNDCILNGAIDTSLEVRNAPACKLWIQNPENLRAFPTEEIVDPADLSRSEYQVGNIVKVIDSTEHHSEWGTFEVVECHHNLKRYRTTESYLSETDWYYTISSLDGVIQFFVSEIEICDADMSWNINTQEIF